MADRVANNCPCGCDAPTITGQPHEPHWNNLWDDAPMDLVLRDPEFVVQKLSMMRCHIKKLTFEKLEKDSENRSLKKALYSYGTLYISFFTNLYTNFTIFFTFLHFKHVQNCSIF